MSEELKACPFCGGEATLYSNESSFVSCNRCCFKSPTSYNEFPSLHEKQSVDYWNTRTPDFESRALEAEHANLVANELIGNQAEENDRTVRALQSKLTSALAAIGVKDEALKKLIGTFCAGFPIPEVETIQDLYKAEFEDVDCLNEKELFAAYKALSQSPPEALELVKKADRYEWIRERFTHVDLFARHHTGKIAYEFHWQGTQPEEIETLCEAIDASRSKEKAP